MKLHISILILIIPIYISAQTKSSNKKLNQVLEDFRTSIIDHNDIEKFSNLFLHDSITWSAIFTNKTKEMALKQMPDFTFDSSNYTTFFKGLKDGTEEKFYNVKIDQRDKFATISFDYTLSINSKIENWGVEYWSLMLINDTWKITSVTWTMNSEEIEKCSFLHDDIFKFD